MLVIWNRYQNKSQHNNKNSSGEETSLAAPAWDLQCNHDQFWHSSHHWAMSAPIRILRPNTLIHAPHHMGVCTTLIYTLSSLSLTIWGSAPLSSIHSHLCPSPYGGLHHSHLYTLISAPHHMGVCTTLIYTLSSLPLTIWGSAPLSSIHSHLCPSPYGGLHHSHLYTLISAPHHMGVCTTLIYTLSSLPLTIWGSAPLSSIHSHLCPSPYGGLHHSHLYTLISAPHHMGVCTTLIYTLSSLSLTIWGSAPLSSIHSHLCPSPYGSLHQTPSPMPLTV